MRVDIGIHNFFLNTGGIFDHMNILFLHLIIRFYIIVKLPKEVHLRICGSKKSKSAKPALKSTVGPYIRKKSHIIRVIEVSIQTLKKRQTNH
jgi:hypothetical protein